MVTSPFVFYLADDSLFFLSAARAYYLSSSRDPENLTRAEAALQELIATTENQVSVFTFSNPEFELFDMGLIGGCRIPAPPMDAPGPPETKGWW
jgi:thiaminase